MIVLFQSTYCHQPQNNKEAERAMGCNNFSTRQDDELLARTWAGEHSVLSPELVERVREDVQRDLEEAEARIQRLQIPLSERTEGIIKQYKEESRERQTVETPREDKAVINAFGVVPIEVSGFEKSALESNDRAIEVLRQLPEVGLLGFDRQVFTAEPVQVLDEHGEVMGYRAGYMTRPKDDREPVVQTIVYLPRIAIETGGRQLSEEEARALRQDQEVRTIIHEYAHGIWRNFMRFDNQYDWLCLHTTALQTRRFATERSKDSPDEDFCESFMLYYRDPDALRSIDPAKHEYMKGLVKDLEEESERLRAQFGGGANN